MMAVILWLAWGVTGQAGTYTLFESGPVRPITLTADGSRLLVLNLPDARLEVFAVSDKGLRPLGSVPTGLDPVAVEARSNNEAWVVNHLSDSVSVIDFSNARHPHVVRTLLVGDEPQDVVFAGPDRGRAFVTTAHRGQRLTDDALALVPGAGDPQLLTPGIGRADVWVFDAQRAGVAGEVPIAITTLFADAPRSLATSPEGDRVYVAAFHSGNRTATVAEASVCDGGALAPECTVNGKIMPGGLPGPNRNLHGIAGPEVGLIARFDAEHGQWTDTLGRDWSNAMPFSLPDYDVFVLDAMATPPTIAGAISGVGTTLFNIAVNPASGIVYVSNTEAQNHIRFEGSGAHAPTTLQGHLAEARISILSDGVAQPRHLNSHINYDALAGDADFDAAASRHSVATPLDMAVSRDGARLYVAAFGSGRVAALCTTDLEQGVLEPTAQSESYLTVDGGPAGLALDDHRNRLYVYTRFDNAVVVVDLRRGTEIARFRMQTPEPETVIRGRPILYDAVLSSANGEASCASCHIFADSDQLAWDLGNPGLAVTPNPNPLNFLPATMPAVFHPLKGPMVTQTLRGLAGHAPYHWRGDRTGAYDGDPFDELAGLLTFNPAFVSLLGRSSELDTATIRALAYFLLEITPPPNPVRNLDNSLTAAQTLARTLFNTSDCVSCHVTAIADGLFGSDGITAIPSNGSSCGATQPMKTPNLRSVYRKLGRFATFPSTDDTDYGPQTRGFGLVHDGHRGGFETDMAAEYILAFESNLAPIVGQQVTITRSNLKQHRPRVDLMVKRASTPMPTVADQSAMECDLVVKALVGGRNRGWLLRDGLFHPDRAAEHAATLPALLSLIDRDVALSFSCVAPGSGPRMAFDRDNDGIRDGDELDMQESSPRQLVLRPQYPASNPLVCNDLKGKDLAEKPGSVPPDAAP